LSTLYIIYILLHTLTSMKGTMTSFNSLFIYKPFKMKIRFYQTHTLVLALFANLVKVECHPKYVISLCQFPYCSNRAHLSLVEDGPSSSQKNLKVVDLVCHFMLWLHVDEVFNMEPKHQETQEIHTTCSLFVWRT
jgi:hypothetical protein